MRLQNFVLVFGLAFTFVAAAQPSPDHPDRDETFSHFFQRITSSPRGRGVPLEASESFQNIFLDWYRTNQWVGVRNKIRRQLEEQGVDLWFDWFQEKAPVRIILPSADTETAFAQEFERQRRESCVTTCRDFETLKTAPLAAWSTFERGAFAITYTLRAPIFGGLRLVDLLATSFNLDGNLVTNRTLARVLPHDEFVEAVRELGWQGPIYFRGITAPDPKDPTRKWIVIDGDNVKSLTNYQQPLLQLLEYVGILVHELGHACQDLEGHALGLDLEIRSLEGALLIEGEAEHLAEAAMFQASDLQSQISPLALYAAEQGMEIMDKDLTRQPESMPYKVGLALQQAVWKGRKSVSADQIRLEMYKTILLQQSLDTMLKNIEGFPQVLHGFWTTFEPRSFTLRVNDQR